MSCASCFTPLSSVNSPTRTTLIGVNPNAPKVIFINNLTNQKSKFERFQSLEVKASTDDTKSTTKVTSIVCADCEGNGSVQCKQCEGHGVNTQDHFGGRFKAGGLCWLCRGKRRFFVVVAMELDLEVDS